MVAILGLDECLQDPNVKLASCIVRFVSQIGVFRKILQRPTNTRIKRVVCDSDPHP